MDAEIYDHLENDPEILREEFARQMVRRLGYDGAVDYARRNHLAGLLADIVHWASVA